MENRKSIKIEKTIDVEVDVIYIIHRGKRICITNIILDADVALYQSSTDDAIIGINANKISQQGTRKILFQQDSKARLTFGIFL